MVVVRVDRIGGHRGIDGGKDIPQPFLEYLYDSISKHEIKMHNPAAAAGTPLVVEFYFSLRVCLCFVLIFLFVALFLPFPFEIGVSRA